MLTFWDHSFGQFTYGVLSAASLGGREIAYSSFTFIGLIISAFVLLTAFVAVELYVSEEPILPIELFANRTVLASSLTNWFYTMSIFTTLFYVPIYYSSVIGLTPTENGLRLVPNFSVSPLDRLELGFI